MQAQWRIQDQSGWYGSEFQVQRWDTRYEWDWEDMGTFPTKMTAIIAAHQYRIYDAIDDEERGGARYDTPAH